jgi:hypothetical protein
MQVPVPPTIPPTSQFSSSHVNNLKVSLNYGPFISNGYIISRGNVSIIETEDVTYTAQQFCNGIIIRTTLGNSDTFPDAADVATELELPTIPSNQHYLKSLSITNLTGDPLILNTGAHTTLLYSGNTIPNGFAANLAYNIWFDDDNIWQMQMYVTGFNAII